MIQVSDVIHEAISRIKTPYIWGCKGRRAWTPDGVKDTRSLYGIDVAYDCSGLVTAAFLSAGGPDMRFTHNAALLREDLPPGDVVVFFPGHVGLLTQISGQTFIIEAAGGDHTTTTLTESVRRNAFVRMTPYVERKRPNIGLRGLP